MNNYVNGSDLLLKLAGGCIGHCTTHTATYTTETADVAVKPKASVAASPTAGRYKSKRVKGLAIQIKASGLKFWGEDESGFKKVLGEWAKGQTVPASMFERDNDAQPYLSGNFIISELTETNPAAEDASYDVTLDLDGEPTVLNASVLDSLAVAVSANNQTGE